LLSYPINNVVTLDLWSRPCNGHAPVPRVKLQIADISQCFKVLRGKHDLGFDLWASDQTTTCESAITDGPLCLDTAITGSSIESFLFTLISSDFPLPRFVSRADCN
jgi:hypothetical protein